MTNIYNILSYLILYLVSYYNISFLLGPKKKKRFFLFLLGMFLFSFTIMIPNSVRILFQLIVLTFIFFLSYKKLKESAIATMFHFFILLFSDVLITSMVFIINKHIELPPIIKEIIPYLWILLSCFLIRHRLFFKFWQMIQKNLKECLYIFLFLIFILIYISLSYYYEKISILIIVVLILILTILLIKKMIEGYSLERKIQETTNFMKIYEDQIDELRIHQHEYQNILASIKSMTQNEEATEFINKILEKECNQDYELLKDIQKIPISPLRGLLYYKLSFCKEKEVQFILNIDSNIKEKHLKKLDTSIIKDISMILGTLLDNAIEACLETKSKSLSIYIYKEESNLVFQISNTFQGTIHIDFIYKKGYSTKGHGHGYGLSLVQKKIKENKRMSIKTEIQSDIFIQYFKIDLN